MPMQHSDPARQTRSQARTSRAPLDSAPAVPQLRAQLDRGPIMEGAAPSRKEGRGQMRTNLKVRGEDDEGEEENSVEEEESDGTEGVPSPV
ncbi:hypothetical protein O181_050913 [Austropuccinia psidii MF-1]|uniref:Uncharacterized protein n=1 Tax=Austropuccinia psidii MF-1 TaxID=1389203 RepID=A0A9Q3E2N1_9BASI|nr:hypothetical protein [Austropuccinia psidii MF-1]